MGRDYALASQVETLWRKHRDPAFPPRCHGRSVKGIDLVVLDGTVAGCISTFLERSGKMDAWRLAIVGLCYRDLAIVVAVLRGESRKYFARLERLAGLVLGAVREKGETRAD